VPGELRSTRLSAGWVSDIPTFESASPTIVTTRLGEFVRDAQAEQTRAWRRDVPWLQREFREFLRRRPEARSNWTILEYELPREFRRPDVIVLKNGVVVVIELKGFSFPSQAALDQVSAYARDLRAYHSYCRHRRVIPVLVTRESSPTPEIRDDVTVVGPGGVGNLLREMESSDPSVLADPEAFLSESAYQPLPTIVDAARRLFRRKSLPWIQGARANTEPALEYAAKIAHRAARNKTRQLILITGVPGAGKTLVGLQLVHSGWLDDLSVPRMSGKPTAPGVYLSGNGPLVDVLQHALRTEGASGAVFVQAIKKFIHTYLARTSAVPPEHLVVFDEAQRAHDAQHHASVHRASSAGKSEPANLLEICSRIPGWSVIVALVGTGQAIHVGEEGGLDLWAEAVRDQSTSSHWDVHGPTGTSSVFASHGVRVFESDALSLDSEIRYHLTPRLHELVDGMLSAKDPTQLRQITRSLFEGGYRLLLTRDLDAARRYLFERYEDSPNARFGLLASSKDKILPNFGVDNTYQSTKRLRVGPWYNAEASDAMSCCRLATVATEFSSQGLELDATLLAWGSDLRFEDQSWNMDMSRGTRKPVQDPLAMRKNVYRVLLTRGRDATVVFVPPDKRMNSTHDRLVECGLRSL
jgi:hypothetical protein